MANPLHLMPNTNSSADNKSKMNASKRHDYHQVQRASDNFCCRRASTTAIAVLTLVSLASSALPVAQCFVVQPHTTVSSQRPILGNGRYRPAKTVLGYEYGDKLEGKLRINTDNLTRGKSMINNGKNIQQNDQPTMQQSKQQETASSSSSSSSCPISAVFSGATKSQKSPKISPPPKTALVNIRYRGQWYDVTKWRRAHSAGAHWLDWFDKRDATEIIDGLHSTHSRRMTTRLPKAKPELATQLEAQAVPDSKVQLAFRDLFDKLLAEGWWERDMVFEASQLSIWAGLVVGAVATVQTLPYLSIFLLALSFTGAGWLGHDYLHGLDPFAKRLRLFLPMTTGLSGRWWSDKHNKHHALTNEIGVDEDMATDPILYTWAPDPSQDSAMRKFQHYIFWIPFTFLKIVWRIDSMIAAVRNVRLNRPDAKPELYSLLIHYAIIFTLFPANILLPSFLLSGIITALVVTSTHQSEEKFSEYQPDYVTRQFLCTRSVVMTNPVSAWIWGGMQYQIEHHLFPSIPRSKLPALKPIMQKFAEDNNVQGGYRESGELEILRMNWETYRAAALADPVQGAPLSRGQEGQQGAIAEGFTAVNPIINKDPK